jgi:hypothetical protein
MQVRPTGPILPPSNIQGNALMVVIAIMSFLACLTLGGVSMVRATASSWESQISREITIQIKPDDGLDMNATLAKARELALSFVGTKDGTIMDDGATARLLEPWLGSGLDLKELPVPRLVIITIDESNPPDFQAMRDRLHAEIPQAFLDDHRTWVDRLVSMAKTTVMIGGGILILVFTAMILTVVFATRGAFAAACFGCAGAAVALPRALCLATAAVLAAGLVAGLLEAAALDAAARLGVAEEARLAAALAGVARGVRAGFLVLIGALREELRWGRDRRTAHRAAPAGQHRATGDRAHR